MIQHPDQIGRIAVALELITRHPYRTSVNGLTAIKIELGNSSVAEFMNEEEFLVWMLSMIEQAVKLELKWFSSHHPADYDEGGR